MASYRPKIPLGYIVYICYENLLAKWRLVSEGGGSGGGGGICKIKLNYMIFKNRQKHILKIKK